jgi:hypothetical protein
VELENKQNGRQTIRQVVIWLLFVVGSKCFYAIFISGHHNMMADILWWVWTFPVFEILVYASLPENVASFLWILQTLFIGSVWYIVYRMVLRWRKKR